MFNLKVVAVCGGYAFPAVALGAAQLGCGFDAVGHLVASRTLNDSSLQYRRSRAHAPNLTLCGVRLHVGVTGARDEVAGTGSRSRRPTGSAV